MRGKLNREEGRMGRWKKGKMEEREDGRMECWKDGRMEERGMGKWNVGMLEEWVGGKASGGRNCGEPFAYTPWGYIVKA